MSAMIRKLVMPILLDFKIILLLLSKEAPDSKKVSGLSLSRFGMERRLLTTFIDHAHGQTPFGASPSYYFLIK